MDWNATVALLGPRLYNYFIRRGLARDSMDLTQEVFSRLYQKWEAGAFDPAKGNIASFAFGIARFVAIENQSNSQIRWANTDEFDWESLHDPARSTNLEQDYQKNQMIELFLKEIKSLTSVQQEVITLYMDDEMTLDQIAELLGLPVGTVKSHLFRSKEKLKDLLETKGISL